MKKIIFVVFSAFLFFACNKENETTPKNEFLPDETADSTAWAVPISLIQDGLVGKDGIKTIDKPLHVAIEDVDFLSDDDLVLGILVDSVAMAYPVKILNYHEIVNDRINDLAFSISYSPLTGTGIVFEGSSTFGVSGLVYNSNLILYDKTNNSLWSQILMEAINGTDLGDKKTYFPLIETTWKNWKTWNPQTQVLGFDEKSIPDYDFYPYGDYLTNNDSLLFSVTDTVKSIPTKERILGLADGEEFSYFRFSDFNFGKDFKQEKVNNTDLIIFGSSNENFMFAFHAISEKEEFIQVEEVLLGTEPNLLFKDTFGTVWDISGKAISGTRAGDQLSMPKQLIGYAFALNAFYPDVIDK